MFVYEWLTEARRIKIKQAVEQGRQERERELGQKYDRAFAGDKDAMAKRDAIFNGATETR